DGQLSPAELTHLLRRPTDLELTIRVGKLAAQDGMLNSFVQSIRTEFGLTKLGPVRMELCNPAQRDMPLAGKGFAVEQNATTLTLGLDRFDLLVADNNAPRFTGARQYYLQQFKAAAGKQGYVEKAKAQNTEFGFFFDLADRDGDGKLTEKELVAV